MPMELGDYVMGHELGRGSFAVVYHTTEKSSGRECATKVVDLMEAGVKGLKNVEMEVQCLTRLKHPHIVEVLAHFQTEGKMFIVLELLTGGTPWTSLPPAGGGGGGLLGGAALATVRSGCKLWVNLGSW